MFSQSDLNRSSAACHFCRTKSGFFLLLAFRYNATKIKEESVTEMKGSFGLKVPTASMASVRASPVPSSRYPPVGSSCSGSGFGGTLAGSCKLQKSSGRRINLSRAFAVRSTYVFPLYEAAKLPSGRCRPSYAQLCSEYVTGQKSVNDVLPLARISFPVLAGSCAGNAAGRARGVSRNRAGFAKRRSSSL